MGLEQQINNQIKDAMKAKDKERLNVLRSIKSSILLEKTASGAGDELDEATETKLLQKLGKQLKDSLDNAKNAGRADLEEEASTQLTILEEFLPEMMGEAEVKKILEDIIAKVGATGPQDMGKVMGAAMGALRGKADGGLISSLVKQILGS